MFLVKQILNLNFILFNKNAANVEYRWDTVNSNSINSNNSLNFKPGFWNQIFPIDTMLKTHS